MGRVWKLPVSDMGAQLLPVMHGRRGAYAIGDVAQQLRISHLDVRTIIDKLRLLAAHDGMPLPDNPRTWGREIVNGPQSICRASLWDAGRFDAWLDNRHPPSPAAAAIAAGQLRDQLAANARNLVAPKRIAA